MVPTHDALGPESAAALSASQRRRVFLLAVVLVLATLAAYTNSFTAPFIYDDHYWLVYSPPVGNQSEALHNAPWTMRPLWHRSLALNYAFGGLDVRGYHLVNLGINLAAGLLVLGHVHRTILRWNRHGTVGIPAAEIGFAVALLWLVHPLQTQSVTYIVQRGEAIMGMFLFLCLYCLNRAADSSRGAAWYLAAVAACVLGLASKEVMVAAPPVALLYDRAFLAPSWSGLIRRRGWFHAVLFASAGGLILASWGGISGGSTAGFGYQHVTPLAYLASQPGVILHYLKLAFWPHPLCFDYLWPAAASPAEIWPPAAAVAGLVVASCIAWRRQRWVGFLGASFFLVLAPTSSVMPIADLAVEHRMYVPLAPVVILTVLSVYGLTRWLLHSSGIRQFAWLATLASVAALLLVLTRQRNEQYREPLRLWAGVLEIVPHNYRAHTAMGDLYGQEGDRVRQRYHYEQAIVYRPNFAPLHLNLGSVLSREGNIERALECNLRALELRPTYVDALINCGRLLMLQDRWDEALDYCRRALEIRPTHVEAQETLANVLYSAGRTGEALAAYRRVLEHDPQRIASRVRVAWILATATDPTVRDGGQAVRLAEQLLAELGDRNYRAWDVVAAAYAETGRFDQARSAAEKALQAAGARGRNDVLAALEERLESYRRDEPYRDDGTETSATLLTNRRARAVD